MSTFGEIATATRNLSTKTILKEVLRDKSIEAHIFSTIRNRVIQTGIVGTNDKLRTDNVIAGEFYSPFTQELKEKYGRGAGRITDHVTLWDSGDFWSSLKFEILENSFKIDADFVKEHGNMYQNFETQFSNQKEFEDAVLSLNEKELKDLVNKLIVPEFFKKFYAKLQN